jgi:hypothetical protein
MDKSKMATPGKGKIPEAPKTDDLGFKGGVIQGFPTQGKATKNEFCRECSGHCDCGDGCKCKK